jgi:hypothetical protein
MYEADSIWSSSSRGLTRDGRVRKDGSKRIPKKMEDRNRLPGEEGIQNN